MKKLKIAAALAAAAILFAGCGAQPDSSSKYDFTIPDPRTEFVVTTITDAADDSVKYVALQFDGKTYIKYGTLNGELNSSDLGSCLGYLVQDDQKITDIGIFPLSSDPDMNYLVTLDNKGIMDKPSFFRNSETVGKDISTPSFIESEGNNYWTTSN